MRIRGTKPEFWSSNLISSVSWDARLVLKGLESYVDDNGVGKDDIELIVSDIFKRDAIRDSSRTVARVSEAISELTDAGLLWRYVAEDNDLLYISFWESVQRVDKPQSGRFPRPDGTWNYKDSIIRESVAKPRDSSRGFAPVTEEQGNRGSGIKDLRDADAPSEPPPISLDSTYPKAFEVWWEHYPRKAGKRKALDAWKRARRRATDEQLIDGAKRYAADPNRRDDFTKYPEGWLNRDGWLDEPLPGDAKSNAGGIAW